MMRTHQTLPWLLCTLFAYLREVVLRPQLAYGPPHRGNRENSPRNSPAHSSKKWVTAASRSRKTSRRSRRFTG